MKHANLTLKGPDIAVTWDDFDTRLGQALSGIGGRYNKVLGGYTFPRAALPKVSALLAAQGRQERASKEVEVLRGQLTAAKTLPGAGSRVQYKHQTVGAEYLLVNPQAVLLDEQGLGKGFQSLWATEARMVQAAETGEPFRCLIVAEVSMVLTWVDEILGCFDENGQWKPGPFPHRKVAVFKPKKDIPEGLDYLVVSWETMRSNLDAILEWAPHQIIGDEIYKVKNPKSQLAKALNQIKTDFAIGMTGTLIPNKVEDCWFPISYFRPGVFPNLTKFKQEYCVLGNRFSKWAIVGYKNLDKLEKVLKTETLRRKREECLDMPDRIFAKMMFELTPAQRKLYLRYRDEALEEINDAGEIVDMNTLTRILRLNQIANNPALADPDLPFITTKYDAIIEQIETSDEQFIVWSNFREVLEYLKQQLGPEAAIIYGGVDAKRRKEIIDSFQAGRLKVFLGLPAACRAGITLTRGKRMDYLDRNFNLLDRLQSQDRNYRIGQNNNVVVTDYLMRGTIDELTLLALQRKENTMERLTTGAISAEGLTIPKSMIMDFLKRQDI